MSTPNLCPMPLQVDRMPLSWYCLTPNKDEATGFRVWGDRKGEALYRVSLVKDGQGQDAYQVSARDGMVWVRTVWFQASDDLNGARARAIRCAEIEEASRFNAWENAR